MKLKEALRMRIACSCITGLPILEKFWKIVNFYYNNGKAWIPGRNREKLENLLKQEAEKKNFMNNVLK